MSRSKLQALGSFATSVVAAVCLCGFGRAQQRPPKYSTHDWTATGNADSLREQWADVKTPWGPEGSRRTYTVGTIEVRQVNLGSSFSGAPAERSGNLPGVRPKPADPAADRAGGPRADGGAACRL
jgi:hypothetical protein